jgi:hypothetical protein
MNMDTNTKPSLGDRYSDWAVIAIALVAVFLGWLLMSNVQSSAVPFDAGGVKGQMPAGWVTDQADTGVVLHTSELGGSGFGTTYQLEVVPVAGNTSPADVASLYSIERAQNLNTVRVLDQQNVTVNGQDGYTRRCTSSRARRGLFLRSRRSRSCGDLPGGRRQL